MRGVTLNHSILEPRWVRLPFFPVCFFTHPLQSYYHPYLSLTSTRPCNRDSHCFEPFWTPWMASMASGASLLPLSHLYHALPLPDHPKSTWRLIYLNLRNFWIPFPYLNSLRWVRPTTFSKSTEFVNSLLPKHSMANTTYFSDYIQCTLWLECVRRLLDIWVSCHIYDHLPFPPLLSTSIQTI